MSRLTKVAFNLPEEDVAALKDLAIRRQTTVTHVIRQAIASEKFLDEEISRGGKILVERDNSLREVVFKL
jgi:predicted transcriptional regulator